jgi:hypothetical protein
MNKKGPLPLVAGDQVLIVGPTVTRYQDRKGMIRQMKPFRSETRELSTLDKYLVKFTDGDEGWFFSYQLSRVDA